MATVMVGMMGKSGSGKDTVAAHLVAKHGFTRLAFADILKTTALQIDPIMVLNSWTETVLTALVEERGWDEAKKVPEVRRFLQALGAAVRDNVHEDAWVDPVLRAAADISGPVVITDVRYPNEHQAVHYADCYGDDGMVPSAHRAYLWRAERPGAGLTGEAATHASETALDGLVADLTIVNGDTIEALHLRIDAAVRDWGLV